jgi:RES domain-containing protein
MISTWRLIKEKLFRNAFSGEGASLYPGRWNNRGIPVVYTAGSVSLSVLELFVHLGQPDSKIRFCTIRVDIPDSVLIEDAMDAGLPQDWRAEPPPESTREAGTRWFEESRSAVLRVPSIIVPTEFNYVLNPGHPDFQLIKMSEPEPFSFDPRMWK